MTLKQAVKEVIEQNMTVCKYRPARFIQMTKNGEVENLEEVISGLVSDPKKMDRIITDLETYKGKPIFIEEFIAMYGFNLANEVIRKATQRTESVQKLRLSYTR